MRVSGKNDMAFPRTFAWLRLGPATGLRSRIYRAVTLGAAGLCLLLIVPLNAALGLTPLLNAVLATFGSACLGLHALARAGHPLPGVLCLLIVALLDTTWFLAGGSQGTAVM